jgi:hypothetical protein
MGDEKGQAWIGEALIEIGEMKVRIRKLTKLEQDALERRWGMSTAITKMIALNFKMENLKEALHTKEIDWNTFKAEEDALVTAMDDINNEMAVEMTVEEFDTPISRYLVANAERLSIMCVEPKLSPIEWLKYDGTLFDIILGYADRFQNEVSGQALDAIDDFIDRLRGDERTEWSTDDIVASLNQVKSEWVSGEALRKKSETAYDVRLLNVKGV